MNNAVFGKTTENLFKRLIVQLVSNQSNTRKLTTKPTCWNRPIYVGSSILDLSKHLCTISITIIWTQSMDLTHCCCLPTLIVYVIPLFHLHRMFIKIWWKTNIFSTHRNMTQTIHYIVQKIRKSCGKGRTKHMASQYNNS